MANIWDDKIGSEAFGTVKQAAIGQYPNIKALLQALPYDSTDEQGSQAGEKLGAALQDGFGLNAEFAGKLNIALADPSTRDRVVKLAKTNSAGLNQAMDQIIPHIDQLDPIVDDVQKNGKCTLQFNNAATDAPKVIAPQNSNNGLMEIISKVLDSIGLGSLSGLLKSFMGVTAQGAPAVDALSSSGLELTQLAVANGGSVHHIKGEDKTVITLNDPNYKPSSGVQQALANYGGDIAQDKQGHTVVTVDNANWGTRQLANAAP